MIKRLLGNNECRLLLLHQHEPIRAHGIPTIPLLEAQDDSQRSSLRYTGLWRATRTGASFASGLELRGRALLLRVVDLQARYPLPDRPLPPAGEVTASDG